MEKEAWKPWRVLLWLILILLTLTLIGLATFLLYPRIPTVQLASFDIKKGAEVNIKSDNYISYHVNSLDGMVLYDNETVGSFHLKNFIVKARSTTNLAFPITITITKGLIQACIGAVQISAIVQLEVDLKLTSWTGKKFHRDITVTIPCPRLDDILEGTKALNTSELAKLWQQYKKPLLNLIT